MGDASVTGSQSLYAADAPPASQNLKIKVNWISCSYLCFLQLRFEEDFEGNNVLALLFSCQVDVAKLALAKWTANVKVVQLPSLAGAAHWTCLSTSA